MFFVSKKKLLNSLSPAVEGNQSDLTSEMQNMQLDEKSSGDGSSSSRPQKPYRIYGGKIDASRVPRIFYSCAAKDDDEEEDGFYAFPSNDRELLELSPTPSFWWGFSNSSQPVVYRVEVDADSFKVPDCVKLLEKIGCENRLISCSVEKPNLFFAHLNRDEAAKLEGSDGIYSIFPALGTYV